MLRDGTVRVPCSEPDGSFAVGRHSCTNRRSPRQSWRCLLVTSAPGLSGSGSQAAPSRAAACAWSRASSASLWHPSDSVVATGSDDGTVRIGRVTARSLMSLRLGDQGAGLGGGLLSATAPACLRVADRTIRLWPCFPEYLQRPSAQAAPYDEEPPDAIWSHTNLLLRP